MNTKHRKPGDVLLDRYISELGAEGREVVRARLEAFVRSLLAVAVRLANERREGPDSPNLGGRRTIPPTP